MSLTRRSVLFGSICALSLALLPGMASASGGCSLRWQKPVGGDWATASNWSPARVPTASDDVCVSGSAPFTVTLSIAVAGMAVRSITLGGSATLIMDNSSPVMTPLSLVNGATIGRGATLMLTSSGSGSGSGVAILTGSQSSPLLTNHGTIVTNAGGSAYGAVLATGLANLGTVHAMAATQFFGAVVNRGTVTIDANQTAAAYLGSNTVVAFDNRKGGTITGAGRMVVEAGVFVENGGTATATPVLLSGDPSSFGVTLSLLGGGAAQFQVATPATVTGTVAPAQTIDVVGGTLGISMGTLTNSGSITLSTCGAQGCIATSGGSLVNKGILNIPSGGGGSFQGSGPLVNRGQLNIANTGALVSGLRSNLTNVGGTITNGGLLFVGDSSTFVEGAGKVTGNPVMVQGPATLDLIGQGAASFTLFGATLTGNVAPNQHLDIELPMSGGPATTATAGFTNAGQILLNATLTLPAGAVLTNQGELTTTSLNILDGSLNNTGLLRFAARSGIIVTGATATSGTLEVGIVPSGPGWLYGYGPVALGGTLKVVTTSTPAPHQTFTVVTGAPSSGQFAHVSFGGQRYAVSYTATGSVLTAP